ncbi:acyl-CoA dehydrogenase NM domain-like protein [Rhodocollybia butyracea]|uniref:Acyl-CoA dehydrogenase NM domain-like protein n=1 Tax=Rhodocollybia butyracea TaxID=206335 RepID=A0A9P5P5H8_9AGAR|nr:acyl-CoA dehydrogenase NM domain-like protein [Rhodocollybia butyracea]
MLRTTLSARALKLSRVSNYTKCAPRRGYATPSTYTNIRTHYNTTLAGLSPSENEFREAVWEFAGRVVEPSRAKVEKEIEAGGRGFEEFMGIHRELAEMGLHGITVPTEANTESLGLSLPYLHHLLTMEALSYVSGGIALSYAAHSNLCINQISRWATPEQKARFLPGLMRGDLLGSLAMSEPGAGSDVLGMKTEAKYIPEKGGYVINGNKFWITNGPRADVVVVYAKDSPSQSKTKSTYTTFIIPRETPGFSTGQPLDKFGMKSSPTCELIFEDVFVPEELVLGGKGMVGKGAKVLMSGLDLERLVLCGGPLGIMQAAYDTTLEYVHTREQFGVRIGTFGSMQAKLANMYTAVNSARTFAYSVARAGMLGTYTYPPLQRRDCAAAILYVTDKASKCHWSVCRVWVGMGEYINEYPAARYLADARLYAVGAGTQEVRRWLVGREINADFE